MRDFVSRAARGPMGRGPADGTVRSPLGVRAIRTVLAGLLGLAGLLVAAGMPRAAAQPPDLRQCSGPGIPIADTLPPAVDVLAIPVLQPVVDPRIELQLEHTFVADLEISVTSPSGTTVFLHDNGGVGSEDFSLTYWDSGVPNGAPYDCSCTMRPSGPGLLRDWQGELTAGLWTITVIDLLPDDDGILQSWCFENYLTVPPAPVENLANVVDLSDDRARVTWDTVGTYDWIRVWLNSAIAATLPGDATEWVSAPLTTGEHRITVRPFVGGAWLDGRATIAVRADLERRQAPGLPISASLPETVDSILVTEALVIEDVQCTVDIRHSWVGDLQVDLTSPGGTTVRLHDRQGGSQSDLIATFTQGGAPHGSTPFGIGAFLEPQRTHDIDDPNGFYEFRGESTLGFWTLSVVDAVTGDNGTLERWGLRWFEDGPPPPITALDLIHSPSDPTRVRAEWQPGGRYDTVVVEVDGVSSERLPGNAGSLDLTVSPVPTLLTVGVFGVTDGRESEVLRRTIYIDIPPVADLHCRAIPDAGRADVTWTPGVPYVGYWVLVDGELEAVLPTNATTYTTEPCALLSTITVEVRGLLPAPPFGFPTPGPAQSCTVDLLADTSDAVLVYRGDGEAGAIDSVGAALAAIEACGVRALAFEHLDPQLIGRPRALWILCGTYPNNTVLSETDGRTLARLARAGIPIYIEGADVWGFDPPTAFAAFDGIADAGIDDGDDSLVLLAGRDSEFGLDLEGWIGPYFQDSVGNDSTDRLHPAVSPPDLGGDRARVIWESLTPAYATGVFYRSTFNTVIAQSWEFGGFGGDLTLLARNYLAALELPPLTPSGPNFRRGDANGDGAIDIGDAIFILSALFTFGAPSPGCLDAADANDDGSIDIGDAIAILFNLFGGGPPLAAPHFICGPDPTGDPIGCADPPTCP